MELRLRMHLHDLSSIVAVVVRGGDPCSPAEQIVHLVLEARVAHAARAVQMSARVRVRLRSVQARA